MNPNTNRFDNNAQEILSKNQIRLIRLKWNFTESNETGGKESGGA